MATAPLRKVTRLPAPKRNSNPHKIDRFAVGVTTSHYWFIDALAHALNKPRSHVLESIISHYIQCVAVEKNI